MSPSRSLLVVRHCESTGQAPNAPLSRAGHAQAERLADGLAIRRITRIVSSPYRRAQETVVPLARRLGIAVELDDRLAERRLSAQPIEDWRDHVARSFVDLDARAPGGESGRETLERGWASVRDALETEGVLLVSHGQLLSLVLHRVDARFGFAGWQAMTNPDVFRIWAGPGGLRYERLPL